MAQRVRALTALPGVQIPEVTWWLTKQAQTKAEHDHQPTIPEDI